MTRQCEKTPAEDGSKYHCPQELLLAQDMEQACAIVTRLAAAAMPHVAVCCRWAILDEQNPFATDNAKNPTVIKPEHAGAAPVAGDWRPEPVSVQENHWAEQSCAAGACVYQRPTAEPVAGADTAAECVASSESETAVRSLSQFSARLVVIACGLSVAERPRWEAFLDSIWPCLAIVVERAGLRTSLERLEHSEKLQRALYAISDMASSDLDMQDMLAGLHAIVGGFMYAENFYIALHDPDADTLRFLYFVDTVDLDKPDVHGPIPMTQLDRGLTWYLIRDGKPLMGTEAELARQISGPLVLHGASSFDWLGVPMVRDGRTVGVLVVQSYIERARYSKRDQALLSFVGNHILTALERKQAREDLERRVAERTRELAKANAGLMIEAEERRRGECLQRVLYRLAELAQTADSVDQFYAAVHSAIGELMDVTNFYIALLSDDGQTLHFPYFVDEQQTRITSRALTGGATEYVLRTGKPLLAGDDDVDRLHREGKILLSGTRPRSWMGVPLLCDQHAVGVIAVQSYSGDVTYAQRDLELLTFVSYQVASSLERKRASQALKEANVDLEQRVADRTVELRKQIAERQRIENTLMQRNVELEAVNTQLAGTQSQLLQSEKMASVGQLAAGVAHEINNPVGYVRSNLHNLAQSIPAIFALLDVYAELEKSLPESMPELAEIRACKHRMDLEFLRADSTGLLAESIEGVARIEKIVRDLKDFSHVDSGEWQFVDLHAGLDTTLNVARNEIKYKADIVKEYGDLPLIGCLPSQLNQVFLNLLVNAAQSIDRHGTITIRTRYADDVATIEISDTGGGIAPENINRVFDPFFTTKPVGVGTGLGLSVSYGIIQKHNGSIDVRSTPGAGTTFTIRLPRRGAEKAGVNQSGVNQAGAATG